MKQGLYCITHKEINTPPPKGRKYMLVGAFNKDVPEGYFSDYSKDNFNISDKNKSYCELTGFYYFTKYDNESDILGLEHYRRFFLIDKNHIFRYHFLTPKIIDELMNSYDIILPKRYKMGMTIKEHYTRNHIESDLVELRNVIEKIYPEYLPDFDAVLEEDTSYFFNMMIGKSSVVKDYATWLFNIEFELEKRIDLTGRDTQQTRVFGYLSERLVSVYFKHNSHIKICEKPVLFYQYKFAFKDQIMRIGRKLKKIFNKK